MTRLLLAVMMAGVLPGVELAQSRQVPLRTTEGLRPHNTTVDAVSFAGKAGVRVQVAPDVTKRPDYRAGTVEPEAFVAIEGLQFTNGVIEAEVAGAPADGEYPGARGFVGIAFRMSTGADASAPAIYDAFYLRPTNGRAPDQERRNHAAQYISHPDWTWSRFRRETPSRYESYVDLEPGQWTSIRIEVQGTQARLYVHGQSQPTLVVNDVKTGPTAAGTIALWIGPGTVAHFRNLVVTP